MLLISLEYFTLYRKYVGKCFSRISITDRHFLQSLMQYLINESQTNRLSQIFFISGIIISIKVFSRETLMKHGGSLFLFIIPESAFVNWGTRKSQAPSNRHRFFFLHGSLVDLSYYFTPDDRECSNTTTLRTKKYLSLLALAPFLETFQSASKEVMGHVIKYCNPTALKG